MSGFHGAHLGFGFPLVLASVLFSLTLAGQASPRREYLLYVGTFTRTQSKGIYLFRFNASTGKLTPLGVAAETTNPSFLAIHPNGRFLYSVVNLDGKTGGVKSYAIDAESGKLRLLNQVSSRGRGPCFVAISNGGNYVLVANYVSGSVAIFPVLPDGRLGEASSFDQHAGSSVNRDRQEGPHAHSFNPSPDDRFGIAADLGLDKLFVYPIAGEKFAGEPVTVSSRPGAGPRHFAFAPSRNFAYSVNELDSTVTAFQWNGQRNILKPMQTTPALPPDFRGTSFAADIHVDPSGRFVYASNRGHDSIAVFAANPRSGELTFVEHASTEGRTPRNFTLDPSGTFLIAGNEGPDDLAVFRVDRETGRLSPTGQHERVFSPACLKFATAR